MRSVDGSPGPPAVAPPASFAAGNARGRTRNGPDNERDPSWHAVPVDRVLELLESGPDGLTTAEAQARLRRHGPNRIDRERRSGALRILVRQLASPLVYVLLASAVLAVLLGKMADGLVVLAVVVVNTVVGFVQELRAGRAIAALSRMVPEKATVLRDGDQRYVPAHELVPGDVVLLQPGDKVPADVRLIEVENFSADEAALTGESLPVAKQVAPVPRGAVVGDRTSMAFNGTLVTSGTATAVVAATGGGTELGHISKLLDETIQLETPLSRRLARLAKAITLGIVVVAVVIFLVGLLREYPLVDSALAAITLAVAAIPEGLPAAITIAAAIGVRRMARRHAIIRHLPAVETLGSTTVICTDKTGTLTRNQMTVQAVWTPGAQYRLTGVGHEPEGELTDAAGTMNGIPREVSELFRAAVLCSDATLERRDGRWNVVGDPTEAALVVAGRKLRLEEEALREAWPRRDVIPFDSERQFMATSHAAPGDGGLVCLKGAPEVVVNLCEVFADGTAIDAGRVHAAADALAAGGMRVLAVACRAVPEPVEFKGHAPGAGLRLAGLIGMIDPPRPEAIEAVGACRRAGIAVKMVTGDHPATARAIGMVMGLLEPDTPGNGVVTGRQIATATEARLEELARSGQVFARVAPEHKLRLVRALQAGGEIVAMTGDGVNDAPALKRADIGVAMGIGGTDAARETADMVLADDNFASIAAAVEEGRRVYDNLIKSLAFILPTSLGQAMIILLAVLFFPVHEGRLLMPIEPVQILWVNLVVAVTLALPLALEAKEPGLMTRPPRQPEASLLSGFLVARTVLVAILMTGGAIGLFFFEYLADIQKGVGSAAALAESQTVAVTTIILFQAIYLLNCRSLTETAFRLGLFTNRYVYYGIATALALQLCFVYLPPLNRLFHTHPLSATDWIAPAVVALAGLPVISMDKRFWRWRQARAEERRANAEARSSPP